MYSHAAIHSGGELHLMRTQSYRRWKTRYWKGRVKRYWNCHTPDDPVTVGIVAKTPRRCGRWCGVCSQSRVLWGPSFSELRGLVDDEDHRHSTEFCDVSLMWDLDEGPDSDQAYNWWLDHQVEVNLTSSASH